MQIVHKISCSRICQAKQWLEIKINHATIQDSNANNKVPNGVNPSNEHFLRELSSIRLKDGHVKGHPHNITFAVKDHETLPNGLGVRFNVETLPAALKEDLNKTTPSRDEVLNTMKRGARFEAVSDSPDTTVFAGGSGFFAACLTSFAQHLPLALSPDHVWAVLSYAFAKHVQSIEASFYRSFYRTF